MAKTTLRGPGWYYIVENPRFSTGYHSNWVFLNPGATFEVDVVDGYYYWDNYENVAFEDRDAAMYIYLDATDDKTSLKVEEIQKYENLLQEGYLSTADDWFTVKLSADWFYDSCFENNDRNGELKLIGDFHIASCLWHKIRLLVNGVYYKTNDCIYLYKDENQTAVRSPSFTTDTTVTTVSTKSNNGTATKTKTVGYVNKAASSDTILSFTNKLNALSANTPLQTTITHKRNLSESIVKLDLPDGYFNVEIDYSLDGYSESKDDAYRSTYSDTALTTRLPKGDLQAVYARRKILYGYSNHGEASYYQSFDIKINIEANGAASDNFVVKFTDMTTGRPPADGVVMLNNPYDGDRDENVEGSAVYDEDELAGTIDEKGQWHPGPAYWGSIYISSKYGSIGTVPDVPGELITRQIKVEVSTPGNAFFNGKTITKYFTIAQFMCYGES